MANAAGDELLDVIVIGGSQAGLDAGAVIWTTGYDAAHLAGRITAHHQIGDPPGPHIQAGREAHGAERLGVRP